MITKSRRCRAAFLACLLTLLLCGASCGARTHDGQTESHGPQTSESPAETTVDEGYLQATRPEDTEIAKRPFLFQGDLRRLSVQLPIAMQPTKNTAGGYTLLEGDREVGSVVTGNVSLSETERLLRSETAERDGLQIRYQLIADTAVADVNERYFHRFVFGYEGAPDVSRTVTVTVAYEAISEAVLEKLVEQTTLLDNYSDPMMGVLKSLPGKPILILGNSFIGSSNIGEILQSMCRAGHKTRHEIVAVSRGYAEVSSSWSDYLTPMRSGNYAAVFMCGFYGADDIPALQQYKDACDASDTPLVIFPAHNESTAGQAAKAYPDLLYLNWKGEIDRLLRTGIKLADFCIDDAHKHSTPLAGYVGAQMIYRAIYGEIPKPGSYGHLAEQLGDYANTGRILNRLGTVYELE